MADIGSISLKAVAGAFAHFRHLRHHRTHVLAGLRCTAVRNMRHLDRVCEHEPLPRGVELADPAIKRWIERVHIQTLSDQGLPNTRINKAVLPFATFLPVRVYYAALYAEVEFLRRHGRSGGALHDRELEALLAAHAGLIDKIDAFRDGFLHPRDSSYADEAALFGDEMHDRIPGLQVQIDLAIERIRIGLRDRVVGLLKQLPETQSLFCRWESVGICMSDPLLRIDSRYGAAVEVELNQVVGRISKPPTPDEVWGPSAHQRATAGKIAEMLAATLPFNPVGDAPDLDPWQPPMNETLHTSLMIDTFARKDARRPNVKGRVTANITAHWRGLFFLMQTATVLLNEGIAKIGIEARTQQEWHNAITSQVPPQEQLRLSTTSMVAVAVQAPILDAYRRVREENPGTSISSLDVVAENEAWLSALHELRKEVFHVLMPNVTSNRVDVEALFGQDSLALLYEGLPKFLSWFVPPLAFGDSRVGTSIGDASAPDAVPSC